MEHPIVQFHPHRYTRSDVAHRERAQRVSELLDAAGRADEGLVACFVVKPLEVLLCREVLFSLGLSVNDARWFVPEERRPAIQASVDALRVLGVEVHRYREVRSRSGRLRNAREALRAAESSRDAHRLRSRLAAQGRSISAVVAGHNVSAWLFARALDARSWIIIDSGASTLVHGYLDAMASEGILGVLKRSAERGKGLSPILTRWIATTAPERTVFFSMYGASNGAVVHNSLPRLTAAYEQLGVEAESALLLFGRESGHATLTQARLEAALTCVPEARRLLVKPHPRDQRPGEGSATYPPRFASHRIELIPSSLAAEEVPMVLGYLPRYILAESPSTSLDTMQRAAGGRITTHVIGRVASAP